MRIATTIFLLFVSRSLIKSLIRHSNSRFEIPRKWKKEDQERRTTLFWGHETLVQRLKSDSCWQNQNCNAHIEQWMFDLSHLSKDDTMPENVVFRYETDGKYMCACRFIHYDVLVAGLFFSHCSTYTSPSIGGLQTTVYLYDIKWIYRSPVTLCIYMYTKYACSDQRPSFPLILQTVAQIHVTCALFFFIRASTKFFFFIFRYPLSTYTHNPLTGVHWINQIYMCISLQTKRSIANSLKPAIFMASYFFMSGCWKTTH